LQLRFAQNDIVSDPRLQSAASADRK
jgi:hypothetical protein